MSGKQIGLSGQCWHDRLIGELPNIYIYSVNNPSEGYRKATFLRGIDFLSHAPNRERRTLQGPTGKREKSRSASDCLNPLRTIHGS